MKRKIITIAAASFLIMGTVSAASLWGNYKGNAIIKVLIDGKESKTTVPAISYDGKIMVPIDTLKNSGLKYTYDQKKLTVEIKKQKSTKDYANVSLYYAALSAIASDFYNVQTHMLLVESSIAGGSTTIQVAEGLQSVGDRTKKLHDDFQKLRDNYEQNALTSYVTLNYDKNSFVPSVKNYISALTEYSNAYGSLVSINKTYSIQDIDKFHESINRANDYVFLGKKYAESNFRYVQNELLK